MAERRYSMNAAGYRHQLQELLSSVETSGDAPELGRGLLVVGAGTMGRAITRLALTQGLSVQLVDRDPESLERAYAELSTLSVASDSGLEDVALESNGRLEVADGLDAIRPAEIDLAIETVVEQPYVKQELLAELESRLGPDTLLTTNTSTLPLSLIASRLRHPERLVGMHFLLPVEQRMVIEVVSQEATELERVARVSDWCRRLGRWPLVVGDQTGFLVNRLLFPLLARAVELWLEGYHPADVDIVALKAGLGIAPFLAMDLIGLDTTVRAGAGFWRMFPDRFRPSPILPVLVKRKRLGAKVGRGIYRYAASGLGETMGAFQTVDEAIRFLESCDELDEELQTLHRTYAAQASSNLGEQRWSEGEASWFVEVALRTAIYEEILQVVYEGYIADARLADAAWTQGLGYPESTGGPVFEYARLGEDLQSAIASRLGEEQASRLVALSEEVRQG